MANSSMISNMGGLTKFGYRPSALPFNKRHGNNSVAQYSVGKQLNYGVDDEVEVRRDSDDSVRYLNWKEILNGTARCWTSEDIVFQSTFESSLYPFEDFSGVSISTNQTVSDGTTTYIPSLTLTMTGGVALHRIYKSVPIGQSYRVSGYAYAPLSNISVTGFVETNSALTKRNCHGVWTYFDFTFTSVSTTIQMRAGTGSTEFFAADGDVLHFYGLSITQLNSNGLTKYASNFSSTTDSWGVSRVTALANQDGIFGENDVLKFYADAQLGAHYLSKAINPNILNGTTFRVSGKVYLPSTNTNVDAVQISRGVTGLPNHLTITDTDQWVDFSTEGVQVNNPYVMAIALIKDGGITFSGADSPTDDLVYIKDIQVTQTKFNSHVSNWKDNKPIPFPYYDYRDYMWFDGVDDGISFSNITLSGDFSITWKQICANANVLDTFFGKDGSNQLVRINSSTVRFRLNVINYDFSGLNQQAGIYEEWEFSRVGSTGTITINGVSINATVGTGDFVINKIGHGIAENGLTGIYWDFNFNNQASYIGNGPANSNWLDQIGTNHGTVNGSPVTVQEGLRNNATQTTAAYQPKLVDNGELVTSSLHETSLYFEDAASTDEDGYVDIPELPLDYINGATFGVEIWDGLIANGFGSGKPYISFNEGAGSATLNMWGLYRNGTQDVITLYLRKQDGSQNTTTVIDLNTYNQTPVYCVVTLTTAGAKVYLDGTLTDTITFANDTNPKWLGIGGYNGAASPLVDTTKMSKISVFNKALTDTEVKELYLSLYK